MSYTRHETVFPSAARTATTSKELTNDGRERGVLVTLDVTVVPGTVNVQLRVRYKDSTSGKYRTLVQAATRTAVGTDTIAVHAGTGTAAVNEIAAFAPISLPDVFLVEVVHSGATSFTYSVGVSYLP